MADIFRASAYQFFKIKKILNYIMTTKTLESYYAHIPGDVTFPFNTGEIRSTFAVLGTVFLQK